MVDLTAHSRAGVDHIIRVLPSYGELEVRTRAGECDVGWALGPKDVVNTVFPWVASPVSSSNTLYLAARTHNRAVVCVHGSYRRFVGILARLATETPAPDPAGLF